MLHYPVSRAMKDAGGATVSEPNTRLSPTAFVFYTLLAFMVVLALLWVGISLLDIHPPPTPTCNHGCSLVGYLGNIPQYDCLRPCEVQP